MDGGRGPGDVVVGPPTLRRCPPAPSGGRPARRRRLDITPDHGYLVGDGVLGRRRASRDPSRSPAASRVSAAPRSPRPGPCRTTHDPGRHRRRLADTERRFRSVAHHGVKRRWATGSGRGDRPATLVVAHARATPWPPAARLATVPWPRNERGATAGLKRPATPRTSSRCRRPTTSAPTRRSSSTLAVACARARARTSCLVDGHLVTPSLATGCLAGVTRELGHGAGRRDGGRRPVGLLGGAARPSSRPPPTMCCRCRTSTGTPSRPVPGPARTRQSKRWPGLQATTLDRWRGVAEERGRVTRGSEEAADVVDGEVAHDARAPHPARGHEPERLHRAEGVVVAAPHRDALGGRAQRHLLRVRPSMVKATVGTRSTR